MLTVDIHWPDNATPELISGVYRVIEDVNRTGEPTGFLSEHRDDVRMWVGRMMAKVKLGGAVMCTAHHDGRIEGFGVVTRPMRAHAEHSAELGMVLTHPGVRGQGVALTIVKALIEAAKGRDIETITLEVRGNNLGAIAFFEECGFVECGRLPNVDEVGDDRYDHVIMCIQFPPAAHVRRRGSDPLGAGGTKVRGLLSYRDADPTPGA